MILLRCVANVVGSRNLWKLNIVTGDVMGRMLLNRETQLASLFGNILPNGLLCSVISCPLGFSVQ
jgi:hypothetical protein